jgi:hypothetical protein
MGPYAHATWSEHVIPLAISSFITTKIINIYYLFMVNNPHSKLEFSRNTYI